VQLLALAGLAAVCLAVVATRSGRWDEGRETVPGLKTRLDPSDFET